jgi:hypothetical protein
MQNKTVPPKRFVRRPLLLFALLLTGATVLWIGLFLASFDLDHYREQISVELSKQLQLPVRIGHARLELREAGIACRFTDVAIGSAQTSRELRARTVWLQMAWRGLLLRQPLFTELALDEPHLRIAIAPPTEASPQAETAEGDWLDQLAVHRIEVHRGSLDLIGLPPGDGQPRQLRLHALKLDIDNLAKGDKVLFDLSGQLSDDPAQAERFTLKGSVVLSAGTPLTIGAWELDLTTKGVAVGPLADLLPEPFAITAGGRADLTAALRGGGDTDARFDIRLTGQQLQMRPGQAYLQAWPLKQLHLTGTWQRTPTEHRCRELDLRYNDARLTGELDMVDHERHREVSLRLGESTLPLATAVQWLPTALRQNTVLLKGLRPGGQLRLHAASAQAVIDRDGRTAPNFALKTLHGEAEKIAWTLTGGEQFEVVALPIRLSDGRWQVSRGEVRLGSVPIQLTGVVTLPEAAPPAIALELAAKGETRQFAALWPRPLPETLALGGEIAWQAHVEGTPAELAIAVRADLSGLQLGYGEDVTVPPTAGAEWTAQGTLSPTGLRLAHGELLIPPLQGTFQGEIAWADDPTVDFSGSLSVDELSDLYRQIPLLDKLGLHGGVALELAIQGPLTAPVYRGNGTLRGLGLPMHGIIADISALRGQMHFDGRRLQAERLTALLGRSPVELQVNVADVANPHLDLKIRAATVRADELIFRSDVRMLRDLNARLLIDQDSIIFAPVHVRMDQGTRATIHGSVKAFASPKVDLEISGDHANVAEIIALWTDESPAAEATRKRRHAGVPSAPLPAIRISVAARQGDLYGMQFSDATALIVPGSEQLLLHPLDFKVGDGYCNTQVLVDYTGDHPLLRVSGHAENVDAYQIHNELLDRKSIVRGTLRGDFYLQGELGAAGSNQFLSTSYGNFHATVGDGVLRHSPVVATIFSVLNVSQLFRLQLPDVSREGVPFTLLTADMTLDRGMLHSNQLVLESNALDMSYLGRFDLINNQLDLLVVVKPLGTIDKVVSHLPVAGWILTGEERTLLTAQFEVTGSADNPKIDAIPISTLSKGVLGIIQRTLSLPLKLIEDPAILWGRGGEKQ